MDQTPGDVTQLLKRMENGDSDAAEQLFPLVYDQLRGTARRALAGERPGHTLQATELVHEAYFKLLGSAQVEWQGRAHFVAIAARAMRQILVDHARRRQADKRGGGVHGLTEKEIAEVLDLTIRTVQRDWVKARAWLHQEIYPTGA